MIALILAPSKGEAPYPPLAICSLKAWLKRYGFKSTTIDLNREYVLNHKEVLQLINKYFGRPTTFLNTDSIDKISNLDTIYNLELLLKCLYYEDYGKCHFNEEERNFYQKILPLLKKDAALLIESGYKYIGFSTFVSNVCYSLLLGKIIKSLAPQIKIFFGGSSTAYKPIREFMLKSKIADYVLVGEGENAIVKLISDLETNIPKYSIIYSDNIAPKNLLQNEISVPIIADLDELPFPDFTDLNLDNYTLDYAHNYRFVTLSTSRGCVNRCSYCSETQYWKRYRQKSIKRIIEEIEYLYYENNARIFFFCDSLINSNITWLKEFCSQLISKNINIQWLSYVTLNNLDSDLLRLMQHSGCISLTFGIEHVNSNVLKGVNKVSSMGNAKSRLLQCLNFGIFPIANIIYALPNESSDAFMDLLAFVCDPDFYGKILFTFRPYEIRVGSVTTNELMKETQMFPFHDINIPPTISFLKEIINELAKFWLPNNEYVEFTKKKYMIISKYTNRSTDYVNDIYNARRYNIPSILKKIIKLDSLPKLSVRYNEPVTNLEIFISQLMDGTHTVSDIIIKIENVITNKTSMKMCDSVHDITTKTVINNLINLSLKNIVIWN
ncbi:radical SAM protein [Bacteroides sp. 3_1_33FAA]|nr:radical SAM protein [Bacteroides sp. 3_1_33FAA]